MEDDIASGGGFEIIIDANFLKEEESRKRDNTRLWR
jgi:hypothetical protein